MLDAVPPWISLGIAGFFLAMSGVAVAASVHARRVANAIAATAVVRIGLAKEGAGAFEGKVASIDGRSLQSPLTDSPCCWFHAKVEKYVVREQHGSSGGATATWVTLAQHTSAEPFLLSDGSGTSAVFPDGAEVTPTDRSVWYGATPLPGDRNPPRLGPGESAAGLLTIEGTPARRFRYTEERIYAGDPLFVLGAFESEVDADEDDDFDPNHPSAAQASADVKPGDLAPFAGSAWVGRSRFLELRAAASKRTPTRIVAPRSGQGPFLVSATRRDELLRVNRGGSKAALFVAALPAALALLFLWLRFAR